MSNENIVFDHVHLVSKDPEPAAAWYAEKLGGRVVSSSEVRGAPSIVVAFKGATIIIRGQRPGEQVKEKTGIEWGMDHFGLRVDGDFDGFCEDLKRNGVKFTVDPMDFGPTARIAFIEAPDGVSIELLQRKG
ncbi:MAG: VOC family protein [Deltaproteobacteria bacterium]|nr:VOC family protein [Deltaproteobacteria bacterium]